MKTLEILRTKGQTVHSISPHATLSDVVDKLVVSGLDHLIVFTLALPPPSAMHSTMLGRSAAKLMSAVEQRNSDAAQVSRFDIEQVP